MKTLRKFAASIPLCSLLYAFAVLAHAQSISFYEYEGFGGRSISADQSIPNFDPLGMNDAANAAIVRYGEWEICTDAYFRGRCVTLSPGEYPTLGVFDMRNSVSSARMVGAGAPNSVIPAPVMPPPATRYVQPPPPNPAAQSPPVVLYDQYDFAGNSVPVAAGIENLDGTSWNDRAVSMVINQGNWELCTDAYFRGSCSVYGPGSYRDLGDGMVRRLSSLRPADNGGQYERNGGAYISAPPDVAPQPHYPQNSRGAARAILFDNRDLRGGSMVVDGDMPNLDGTGFNDRASSIRVEYGYWMFCSDAGYQGDCRTFGPGDYPNLPDGFERRISSARRVAGPGR